MKYFSIDIETTGLDTAKAELLQVAIVFDDGNSEINKLPTFSTLVKLPTIQYGEPYALAMNHKIFDRIARGEGMSLRAAITSIETFIATHSKGAKLPAAGCNAAQFDLPILFRCGLDRKLLHHRVVDVSSMYAKEVGGMEGLYKINKLTGRGEVTHDALEDALDVVHAIRRALSKERKG